MGKEGLAGRKHRKEERTSVDLDATPIERIGHVVPNVCFVGEKQDVVEAYATRCLFIFVSRLPRVFGGRQTSFVPSTAIRPTEKRAANAIF